MTSTVDWLPPRPPASRGVFTNRTLNLRPIKAIGYDLDYTLVHYHVLAWEHRAYEHLQQGLVELGWPAGDLEFDATFIIRGLAVDTKLGNIVKANRFGYVKRAYHGLAPLEYDAQRQAYSRTPVDLTDDRWVFLNTLFSLSKGCMYAQLVDRLDNNQLPRGMTYRELFRVVSRTLDQAHGQGHLKREIIAKPEHFVDLDPDMPRTLLDQREAGKKVLLITNSEWEYSVKMLSYACDRYLPRGKTWRDLFDLAIFSARKPSFFSSGTEAFEVLSDDGTLRRCGNGITKPGCYVGGNARLVEDFLGHDQDEILYIGDHVYGDVHQSKQVRRWRTALVVRELEDEIEALYHFSDQQKQLSDRMAKKDVLDWHTAQARLLLQRKQMGHDDAPKIDADAIKKELQRLRAETISLDKELSPLAMAAGSHPNEHWGLLMRTGNDKSLMARHVERHADVYTSRVSNFLHETPHAYLRSSRGSLPHDPLR